MILLENMKRLAEKAAPELGRYQGLGPWDLERHLAPEHRVLRQEDDSKTAAAELADDREAPETPRKLERRRSCSRPDRFEQTLALVHRLQGRI